MSSHRAELEKLSEKDPEFYKFLKEQDADLLEFDESDVEMNEELGVEEEEGEQEIEEEEEKAIEEEEPEEKVTVRVSFESNNARV
jgi:nucleolar complex protein 2